MNMPTRNTHLLLRFVFGVAGYTITKLIQKEELSHLSLIIAGAAGAVAGELPDILEPALYPNHRSHAHSIVTGIGISYVATKLPTLELLESVNSDTKAILVGATCGYISHLLADGTTKKGLPII